MSYFGISRVDEHAMINSVIEADIALIRLFEERFSLAVLNESELSAAAASGQPGQASGLASTPFAAMPASRDHRYEQRSETRVDGSFRLRSGEFSRSTGEHTTVCAQCWLCERPLHFVVDFCSALVKPRKRVAASTHIDDIAEDESATPDGMVLWAIDDLCEAPAEGLIQAWAKSICLACAPIAGRSYLSVFGH